MTKESSLCKCGNTITNNNGVCEICHLLINDTYDYLMQKRDYAKDAKTREGEE